MSRITKEMNNFFQDVKNTTANDFSASKTFEQVRVLVKNIIYVVGLPPNVCHRDILSRPDYFGQFGKITNLVINKEKDPDNPTSSALIHSCHVTFNDDSEAALALLACSKGRLSNFGLKVTFGTKKYIFN